MFRNIRNYFLSIRNRVYDTRRNDSSSNVSSHSSDNMGGSSVLVGPIIKLVSLCGGCPEDYDAYINNEKIAYLRLRHGVFKVMYPNVEGEIIYLSHTYGDGIFDENEKEFELQNACKAILIALHKSGKLKLYDIS